MRTLAITALLATLAAPLAYAQSSQNSPDPNRQVISVPSRPYPVFADDLKEFKGYYDLSNGQTLAVTQRYRKLFIKLDDSNQTEIIAVGPNKFVTPDGKVQLEFDPDSSPFSHDVVVTISLPASGAWRVS